MRDEEQALRVVAPEPYYVLQTEINNNYHCEIDNAHNKLDDRCSNRDDDNITVTGDGPNYSNFYALHPVSSTTSRELVYLVRNSIPIFFTFFIQYLVQILIPTYFASKLGSVDMSACTLSITTFYLTGPVLINGFTSSLDTLCSTAYGARHYHKVGHYYIQCTLILLILIIPSMTFWQNSKGFFDYITLIGYPDDSELAHLCTIFLKNFTFVAPAVVIFESTKRFLQSQCKFSIPTRIVISGIPISIFFNIFLKKFFDDENLIEVPALSFVLTYWIMTVLLLLYVVFIDGYQCLPELKELKNWTFRTFIQSSKIYFTLGIPGILMILSEALAFQLITFLSTTFPKNQLAAQSIVSTLASLAFQPPYAVGICCSTHIANLIGARSSNYKPAMNAIYILMASLSLFNFTWFFIFRKQLASLFTSDPDILFISSNLAKIIAINQFIDCFNILCAAILRGQGRQKIGSILSLASYYLIGIPLEFYFAFKLDLKIYGLWIGLALAVNFLSVTELIIVYKSKWMEIIKRNHKLA